MDETRLDKIEIKELEVFANHGVYQIGRASCRERV